MLCLASLALVSCSPTHDDAVSKLIEKLESLRSVSFQYQRSLDYPSDGYRHTLDAKVYVQFGANWKPVEARFRIVTPENESAFNGESYWLKAVKDGRVELNQQPSPEYLNQLSALRNSVVGLARSLRAVVKDHPDAIKAGKDGQDADTITVAAKGLELGVSQPLVNVGYDPLYEIVLDAKTGLPSRIVQKLKDRRDTITTTFRDWNLSPRELKYADWYP